MLTDSHRGELETTEQAGQSTASLTEPLPQWVSVRCSGYARCVHSTSELIGQVLREAIEGGGLAGWATVDLWDGVATARITETGDTVHIVDESVAQRGICAILLDDDVHHAHTREALRADNPRLIDGEVADTIVQFGLFGWIVYR
jgi:hypothetical protein